MAGFGSRILRRFWEEEESDDDDDLIIVAGARYCLKRKKSKKRKKFRGSLPGRQNVPRLISGGHHQLLRDYFSDNSIYNAKHFRRRFQMSKPLFMQIVNAVEAHDSYFLQRPNAAGVLGASSLQKVVAAFRMLAYGVCADFLDDCVRMGESTILEALQHFVVAVFEVFGPTMILEAVASQDLWIWHTFFGLPGSLNDLNVLRWSPLFQRLTSETAPPVEYIVNGNQYKMGYYLADGIYPSWATFVKSFKSPQGNKKVHFAEAQESARKHVERAFGVLQARFAMVRGPARCWRKDQLWYIMQACIIMHNMIVEDERGKRKDFKYHQQGIELLQPEDYEHRDPLVLQEFLKIHEEIEDKSTHERLQNYLIEHLWTIHGSR